MTSSTRPRTVLPELAPLTRAAIRPWVSSTKVVGTVGALPWSARMATPDSSVRLGYVTPTFVANAAPRAGSSLKSMPMKRTGTLSACRSAHVCWSAGASATHGAHQDRQTLSTSTLPRVEAMSHPEPSSNAPFSLTGTPRFATGIFSTAPSPETYPFWSPALACAATEFASCEHPEVPRSNNVSATPTVLRQMALALLVLVTNCVGLEIQCL